jgi:tRNA-intron endonuclease
MNTEEEPQKEIEAEITIIEGKIDDNKVVVPLNNETANIFEESYIGTKLGDDKIEYEIVEALLLMERKRLVILDEDQKEISADTLLALTIKNNPNIWTEYLVYRDLRRRGYIVREGYGQGIQFRLYPRGATRTEDVAKYFIVILAEDNPVYLEHFDTITAQAIKARKELLLAILDRLGDVTYYKLDQITFNTNKKRTQVNI